MEKILLRVAGARAEMGGGKCYQPLRARATAGKIKFLQGAFNPHIPEKGEILAIPVPGLKH